MGGITGGPFVLAVEKFFPIVLGFPPRHELMERGDVSNLLAGSE
jgi:hypothetical protein